MHSSVSRQMEVNYHTRKIHKTFIRQNLTKLEAGVTNISADLCLFFTDNIDDKRHWWTGLNDRATESQYLWSDGTALGVRRLIRIFRHLF